MSDFCKNMDSIIEYLSTIDFNKSHLQRRDGDSIANSTVAEFPALNWNATYRQEQALVCIRYNLPKFYIPSY